MKTFIKVTEIWIPGKDRTQLELASGTYGGLEDFKIASEQTRFNYYEGVPGTAWAMGHPVVVKEFTHSYFKRTDAAKKAGLTCAIGIPVFSGEFLMAVVVFLCGDDEDHAGAIEVWSNDPDVDDGLGVIDGYYGTLDYFEFISRKTRIMKGFGLLGRVWEKGLPLLMTNLGQSESFIRGRDAKNAGMTTALGIPLPDNDGLVYLMTFLSAKATPIARQLEIWMPDQKRERLIFNDGFSAKKINLAELYSGKAFARGESGIGHVWLTGMPAIVEK
ncbi:MAG TPA: GAF domain-containing protein, partial [Methylococcales bacterium]